MIAPRCPRTGRRALIWYEDIAVVNIRPVRILVRWQCPCGSEHEAAARSGPRFDPPLSS